jgi:tetratricopeptide (TPR) repeat protein
VSSEEEAKKKTRRAARRAAQEEPVGDDEQSEAKPTPVSTGKKGKRPSSEARTTNDALSVRDEGLRARDAAVAKRRKKRDRERAQAAAEGLDTGELVDDALARGAHAASRFVQQNFKWLQWVIVLGVAGGFGKLIYDYRAELGNQKGSALLMQGLRAELGMVKAEADLDAPEPGFVDPRQEFDSDQARLKAAAEGYKKAIEGDPEPARQALAKMGLAGVLFDQRKYKEAEQSYREVRDGSVAASDLQLKGEAIEGIALSLEALGKKEEAGKAFKELENLANGFEDLGKYHRARLLYQAGKRDEAKEILKKLVEKSDKDASPFGETGFVALAARQLLEAIDPGAARPPGGGISPEQLKKIQEQIQKAAGLKGGEGADTKELMEQVTKALGEQKAPGTAAPAPAPEPVPVPKAGTPAPNAPAPAPKAPAPKPAAPPAPKPAPAAPAPAPAAPAPQAPAPAAPAPAAPAPAAPVQGSP